MAVRCALSSLIIHLSTPAPSVTVAWNSLFSRVTNMNEKSPINVIFWHICCLLTTTCLSQSLSRVRFCVTGRPAGPLSNLMKKLWTALLWIPGYFLRPSLACYLFRAGKYTMTFIDHILSCACPLHLTTSLLLLLQWWAMAVTVAATVVANLWNKWLCSAITTCNPPILGFELSSVNEPCGHNQSRLEIVVKMLAEKKNRQTDTITNTLSLSRPHSTAS